MSRRCATALTASGVGKGDRIALLSSPRPLFFISLLAAATVGAVWVGLHPRYKIGEMAHVIGEVTAEAGVRIPGDRRPRLCRLTLPSCSGAFPSQPASSPSTGTGTAPRQSPNSSPRNEHRAACTLG